jgi:hypothetical protein
LISLNILIAVVVVSCGNVEKPRYSTENSTYASTTFCGKTVEMASAVNLNDALDSFGRFPQPDFPSTCGNC